VKIQTIDIVGLGALGVMYADFFTKKLGKDKVRVLADGERIARYRENTLTFFNLVFVVLAALLIIVGKFNDMAFLIIAIITLMANLFADLFYCVIDPRIRY